MNLRTITGAEWLLGARMCVERLDWAGCVGLLLILACCLVWGGWLPQQRAKNARHQEESRALRQEITRLSTRAADRQSPQARIDALLASFPVRRDLPRQLERLDAILAEAGVGAAKYQPDSGKSSEFSSVNVSVECKLPYPRLRTLFDTLREKMPNVAIDDLQLTREAIGNSEVSARMRFRLILRQQS